MKEIRGEDSARVAACVTILKLWMVNVSDGETALAGSRKLRHPSPSAIIQFRSDEWLMVSDEDLLRVCAGFLGDLWH
jgi:hypothetical protein